MKKKISTGRRKRKNNLKTILLKTYSTMNYLSQKHQIRSMTVKYLLRIMVNLEENMTNLKDTETKVTVGDRKTLTRTKYGDWHVWHKCDRKLQYQKLTNRAVIPCLHTKIFSVTQALLKGSKPRSEGEALILKRNSTKIRFDEKIANKSGEGFLLTTKFYKSANNTALLAPEKHNPEGKADIQPEGTTINK